MFTKAALSPYRLALALAACLVAVATAPGPASSATADTPPALTPMFFTAIHDAGHNPVTTVLSGATVHDTGSLSSALGTPTGMVSFTWFSNADCGGIGTPAGSVAVSASGLADGSTPVGPLAPGDYSFSAHFTTFNTVQWTDADSACEPLHVTSAPVFALSGTNDAASAYARTIEWSITKSADPASQTVAPGAPATFDYTVTVTHDDGTDSDWQVGGQITVHSQNNAAVDGVTVSDAIDDPNATCVVSGGSSTIPAGGAVAFDYTCTYSSAPSDPSQTSTATISWPAQTLSNFGSLPAGSATAAADVVWGDPTAILNASIDVRDSLNGLLNSLFYTDPSPVVFTYPYTFDPDPAGECTPHDNTASVVNDAALLASATATVEVCSGRTGSDLTVTKTATPTFTRTFAWDAKKSVDRHGETIAAGDDATFAYTVDVTKGDPVDSGWAITGEITVSNPNSWDIDADLADGSCSLEGTSVMVPANGSVAVGYSCSLASGAPGENTATATWDSTLNSTPSGTASGSADYAFTTPTTVLNDSVDVYDNGVLLGPTDHSTKFTYSKSFPGSAGTCTSYDNTATVKSVTVLLASSETVTVTVCAGGDIAVAKTATMSFTRTYKWKITKSVAAPTTVTKAGGGTAAFAYIVNVAGDGYVDSARVVSGKITLTNPNDWQAVTVSLADSLPGCTLDSTSVTVPKSQSVDVGYSCPRPDGSSGTNTATATWDTTAFPTPHGSAATTAAFAFGAPTTELDKTVTVTDTFDGSTSTLGTVAHPGPGTFSYTRTVSVPVTMSCLTHPNTARIVETGQSAGASVSVCGAASTISGTAWNDQNNNHIAGDAGDVVLPGWTIRIYDAQNQLLGSTATDANGVFSFLEPPGTYKLCEVLQAGWVETVPVAGTAACNGTGEAAQGFGITIGGSDSTGNNFGNNLGSNNPPDCKEDPGRAALMTRVVDTTGKTHGPAPVYSTIQKAYDAAANTGEVIGVFTPTTENIVLGGSKTLTITECGAAKETAADNSKPVWDLKSTGKLTIVSPSTYGGTVGWLIETNGNDIKSVRAYNASQYGVRIKGSSNGVSFNSVSGSPVGVQIDGNSNDVRSGTISGNTTGVVIAGSTNSLSGATIGPNTRDGVDVTGSNNTVKGTTATENGGDGFQATGTGTLFDSNKAYKNTGNGFTVAASATGTKLKSNASNTGNSGSSNENGGYEYKFGVAVTNQGSNKKDNVNFTSTAAGNYE